MSFCQRVSRCVAWFRFFMLITFLIAFIIFFLSFFYRVKSVDTGRARMLLKLKNAICLWKLNWRILATQIVSKLGHWNCLWALQFWWWSAWSQEAPTMDNAVGTWMKKTCFLPLSTIRKLKRIGIHYWTLNNCQRVMNNKSGTMEQVASDQSAKHSQ